LLCPQKWSSTQLCAGHQLITPHIQSILPAAFTPLPPHTPPVGGPHDPHSDPPAPHEQPLASLTLSQHQGGPLPSTREVPWDDQEPSAYGNVQDGEAQEEKCFQRAQDKRGSLRGNDDPQPHSMQD